MKITTRKESKMETYFAKLPRFGAKFHDHKGNLLLTVGTPLEAKGSLYATNGRESRPVNAVVIKPIGDGEFVAGAVVHCDAGEYVKTAEHAKSTEEFIDEITAMNKNQESIIKELRTQLGEAVEWLGDVLIMDDRGICDHDKSVLSMMKSLCMPQCDGVAERKE